MSKPLSQLSHLRSRNPAFDSLCEDYEGLDSRIVALTTTLGRLGSIELERLKRRRQETLNLIRFLSDSRHAA